MNSLIFYERHLVEPLLLVAVVTTYEAFDLVDGEIGGHRLVVGDALGVVALDDSV